MSIPRFPSGEINKAAFHKQYTKALRDIAKRLGLTKGTFTVRSSKAGDWMIGDVILHADTLYVSVSGDIDNGTFLYRSCRSQKDYAGGGNQWMPFAWLDDNTDKACATFRRIMSL